MRAIDADKLIDDINVECRVKGRDNADAVADAFNEIIKQINEAPTITADRPRGEWIYHEDYHTCSVCGADWLFTDGTDGSDFCPNCGADMRGEEDAD